MTENLFTASTPIEPPTDWYTAHCDGGSRGNPGPAGYGAVVADPAGQVVARLSRYLGNQTNNFAEYQGLLAVLQWAVENRIKRLRVISDSELMVKQMKGVYKVKHPGLLPLWQEAKRLVARLDGFEMRHTLRGGNKEADRLANEAMDQGSGKQKFSVGEAAQKHSEKTAARKPAQSKQPSQIIQGFVKNGVVHPLEGELPEGAFVKIVRD
jgi:probable phosphoglycerate mutase